MKWSTIWQQGRVVTLPFVVALIAAANAVPVASALPMLPHTPLDMPTIDDPDGRPRPRNAPPLVDYDCWAWDHVAGCSRDDILD